MPTHQQLRTQLLSLLFFVTLGATAQRQNSSYLKYIEQYRDIAIEQQERYRIPASITLAQGLLESGAGKSTLATRSNNHFGIKCHDWKGARTYHDDDAQGECFREYRRVKDSFEDHSKFLAERSRYASLFELRMTDYRGWARGLQHCGYATSRTYASQLIRIIELYELDAYDSMHGSLLPMGYVRHPLYQSSGLNYIEIREGDNLAFIALEYDIKERKLYDYNDLPDGYHLQAGDIIYLEKKNRKAASPHFRHRVAPGESMYGISQRYGIRLKSLYKLNDKEPDYRPQVGDILILR